MFGRDLKIGGESGIRTSPLVQTLCIQRNAANRSPYRHLRSITSGTVVTEKTLINPDRPDYGMDGMDAISSSSPQAFLPHQPKNQRYCRSLRTLRSHTNGTHSRERHIVFVAQSFGILQMEELPPDLFSSFITPVLKCRPTRTQKVSAATHDKAPSYRLNRHNRRIGTCCDFTVVAR